MKNQRRFAPTKTGRFAPEQVAAFLRNQWPESAEYADFDIAGAFFSSFVSLVEDESPGLIDRLPRQQTLNKGSHLIFRCPAITTPGSQKLAYKKVEVSGPGRHEYCGKGYDSKRRGDRFYIYPIAIETKGEGGYIVSAPSPGYAIIRPGENSDFYNAPAITPAEREILIRCACVLDEQIEDEPAQVGGTSPAGQTGRPGDDFNQRGPDVHDLLIRHGYKPWGGSEDRRHYTRPGKERGISGTLYGGKVYHNFSGNDPHFDIGKNYAPFGILALLEHGGDFSKAAAELARQGYGDQTHATTSPTVQARSYNQTDTGNGERFADQHRENVRYCYPTNKWLAWDGTRWKPDSEGLVRQLAKKTTREIYQEAAREPDSEKSTKIGKWAAASESSFRQESMIRMAQSEPGIPILPEQMDTNHWLLNVQNGTIDLKTRELLPHRRSDLITKIVPVEYDPDAECPKWLEFLYTIMGNDDEMVNYLCRVAGYTLTGDAGEQCLFIFHGSGQNGKSTYLNVMQSILDDYALQTGFDTFTIKKNEGIRNDIARMKTARLVVAIEAGDGKRLDEQVVKQLTGGDKVTARFLHQEHFEFRPQFKVVLAANHRPTIYDQNLAIWRRIRLIPFDVTISDAARINNYERVLLEEKQGILNWMVFGCLEWQQAGLATPERVKVATEEYRSEMDVLEDFLDSHCTVGDGLKVTHGILYAAYEGWCEESKEKPFKTRTFAKMMQSRGFSYTKPHNVRTWQRIGIRA